MIFRILKKAYRNLFGSYQNPGKRIEQKSVIESWFADKGDQTFRLNYNLSEQSTVFDLGGYEGQWSSDIFSKYQCVIHVFEPVESFAKEITSRFSLNRKIHVHNFGLAPTTSKSQIFLSENCSSTVKNCGEFEEIHLKNTKDFIDENGIFEIDLVKINIEGSEYELLEYLIEKELISRFKNIQIQFHDFFPEASVRMKNIQRDLSRTHELTWQYPFVWENWILKGSHLS
jgi:FkbM family methyltransferase